jgi:hypothetical protein
MQVLQAMLMQSDTEVCEFCGNSYEDCDKQLCTDLSEFVLDEYEFADEDEFEIPETTESSSDELTEPPVTTEESPSESTTEYHVTTETENEYTTSEPTTTTELPIEDVTSPMITTTTLSETTPPDTTLPPTSNTTEPPTTTTELPQRPQLPVDDEIRWLLQNEEFESDYLTIVLSEVIGNVISSDVLREVAESGANIVVVLENGISYTIIGSTISENAVDFDLDISIYLTEESERIYNIRVPANSLIINPPTQGRFGFEIEFSFSNEQMRTFGFSDNSAFAFLYVAGVGQVANLTDTHFANHNGSITVRIDRASQYVLFDLSATSDGNTVNGTDSITNSTPNSPNPSIENPTSSVNGRVGGETNPVTSVVFGGVPILIVAGVVMFISNPRTRRKSIL